MKKSINPTVGHIGGRTVIKACIFDMDGVIINSEPLHYEVDQIVLRENGISVDDSYLDKFVGYTNPAMWEAIKVELSLGAPVARLINRQISLKLDLLAKRTYKPIEGIPELMASLKEKGIVIGLASSSPREFITGVMGKLHLMSFIDAWESGEEVAESKPAPDIFLHVSGLLGMKPVDCLVIEDSKSGVVAAKSAGMSCIGFQNPHSGNQDLSDADFIVKNIGEIRC